MKSQTDVFSPREQARRLYEKFPQPRDFEDDLALHGVTGYVIETTRAFLVGRAVDRYASEEMIVSPHVYFPRKTVNAWYIWIYVGPMYYLKMLEPYPLRWIGWSRQGGKVRWYECDRLLGRV